MIRKAPAIESLNKLTRYKFLLLAAVVCIHSRIVDISFDGTNPSFGSEFILFLNDYLFDLAVPGFFIISGFLFFREGFLTKEQYKRKMKSRVMTLVVPYFLWCTISLLTIFLKKSGPLAPLFPQYADWHPTFVNIITGYFSFVDERPFDFVLWFVRNLIIVVALAPAIGYIFRKLGVFALILFFTAAYLPIPWSFGVTLAYFSFGAFISLFFGDIIAFANKYGFYFLLAYIAMCGTNMLAYHVTVEYLYIFLTTTGVIALLWVMNKSFRLISKIPNDIVGTAFFIYASHGLFITVLRSSIIKLIPPSNSFFQITDFALTATVALFICISIALILRKIWPQCYDILSGYRNRYNNARR